MRASSYCPPCCALHMVPRCNFVHTPHILSAGSIAGTDATPACAHSLLPEFSSSFDAALDHCATCSPTLPTMLLARLMPLPAASVAPRRSAHPPTPRHGLGNIGGRTLAGSAPRPPVTSVAKRYEQALHDSTDMVQRDTHAGRPVTCMDGADQHISTSPLCRTPWLPRPTSQLPCPFTWSAGTTPALSLLTSNTLTQPQALTTALTRCRRQTSVLPARQLSQRLLPHPWPVQLCR